MVPARRRIATIGCLTLGLNGPLPIAPSHLKNLGPLCHWRGLERLIPVIGNRCG
jgi:hypothetical protein